MGHYIIKNKIDNPKDLKEFNLDNYKYNASLSEETTLVFTR
jgi:cytoplasmic iron level regulating protein YaaA (DUF328/UPF0246 family)